MAVSDETIRDWIADALDRLDSPTSPSEVEWVWNERLRTSAGRAVLGESTIELNPHLFDGPGDREVLRRTVVHEVCHLEAWRRVGRRESHHGPTWRALMERAGVPPERCHDLEDGLRPTRRRRYRMRCSDCGDGIEVGRVRLRRILRGEAYRHVGCGGRVGLGPAFDVG